MQSSPTLQQKLERDQRDSRDNRGGARLSSYLMVL